jgi:1,4-dihydroxy-6-naphthoate synthase
MRLGIPGKTTTAYALCSIFLPTPKEAVSFSYNEIIPAVLSGEVDCGLLIHERRDSLEDKRLHLLADLTDSWCAKTKLPLPLGGLVARLDLGKERLNELVDILQKSFAYAQAHPEWIVDYCLKHSPIKDKAVVQGAISQWVNAETARLSSKGEQSIRVLLQLMGDKAYRKIVYRA